MPLSAFLAFPAFLLAFFSLSLAFSRRATLSLCLHLRGTVIWVVCRVYVCVFLVLVCKCGWISERDTNFWPRFDNNNTRGAEASVLRLFETTAGRLFVFFCFCRTKYVYSYVGNLRISELIGFLVFIDLAGRYITNHNSLSPFSLSHART